MNIILQSKVTGELDTIYDRFDAQLFSYLLPPGAQLIEFGGSKKGDTVHLKLPLAGAWISQITAEGRTQNMRYFIDEGRELPFPLQSWQHKHILHRAENNTIIEDNITFSTGYILGDLLLYPLLFLSFLPRTWQYRRYFEGKS